VYEDITIVKVSFEALVGFAAAMFVPSVAAAWALLHALVFKPLNSLKDEISVLNSSFQKVSVKQLKLESDHSALVVIHEARFDRIEQDLREIRKEIN